MHRVVGRILKLSSFQLVVALGAVLIGAISLFSSPAQASWSGWGGSAACTPTGTGFTGDCPTVQAACESWAQYRGTWVREIRPSYNSSGEISQHTCSIRHFVNAAPDFQDPTFPSCPAGYEVNGNAASGCQLAVPRRALGKCTKDCEKDSLQSMADPSGGPAVGNPIALATGNKFEQTTDYRSGGTRALAFTRYYNSQSKVLGTLGPGWRHNFDRRLIFVNASRTDYHAADGKVFVFTKVGSDWVPDSDVVLSLSDTGGVWTLVDESDRAEVFSSGGLLRSVTERDGYQQAFEYYGPGNSLSLVHDSHGQRLRFTYNADGMLSSFVDDEGHRYSFGYRKLYDYENHPATLLSEVAFPDDTPLDDADNPHVEYLYEDPAFPAALTGLIDESGTRFATWAYDTEGRATSSEHAGAVEDYTVVYNTDGSRRVTNPLGQETIYRFTTINGVPRVSQLERLAGTNTLAATTDFTYDANGFLASINDWEGNVTNFAHDSRGLQTSKTEAFGTPEERTTTRTWHADFRLPTQIVAPGRTVDLTYNADGLLTDRQVTDTTSHLLPYSTNGQTRSWTYSYSPGGEAPGSAPELPDVDLGLVNPGAEAGSTSGWTVTQGAFTIRSSSPAPSEGSYYFYGGTASSSRMQQDITIPAGNLSEVDTERRAIKVRWMQRSDGHDQGAIVLEFLDAGGLPVVQTFESRRILPTSWIPREEVVDVPALTRTIRLTLRAFRDGGTYNDAYFDELSATLVQRATGHMALPIVNNDVETGSISGWTVESGSFLTRSSSPRPVQGHHYFYAGQGNNGVIYQDLPIPSDQHAAVDSSDRQIDVTWWQRSANGKDSGKAIIEFLDGSGQATGTAVESPAVAPTYWTSRKLTADVPVGTRTLRLKLRGYLSEGSYSNAYFDHIFADLVFTDVPRLPLPRQIVTVDGPRSDVTDTTTLAYDALGELESITNPLGQVSSITDRDARGLPLTLVDENGIETALSYDPRGRLADSRLKGGAGDAVTTFGYDDRSLVTTVTLSDGQQVTYEYDGAHRLTAIVNDLGERMEYTLDAMGNRTAEVLRTGGGTIVRSQSQVFDELGRLLQRIGAQSQVTAFGYDRNGNRTSITDPLNGATTQTYDALDRLKQSTDPLNGITGYGYDARDNLASVSDPRSLVTNYTYNGFGEVIQLQSPDSGTTVYTLDAAGNMVSQTDARAVVTDFTYDALNRPLSRSYPATPSGNVTYGYDDTTLGNRGTGRLTAVTDRSGSTALTYDDYGHLIGESRTIGGVSYSTAYGYDVAGNLLEMTYPDGRIVSYGRDSLARVSTISTKADALATPVVVASAIAYRPFGPLSALTFGNGVNLAHSHDQDYRLTRITAGDGTTQVQDLTLGYDAADNITAITDALDATRSQTFQYDDLFRLTQGVGLYGTIDYGYDAVGNRTSRTIVDTAGTLNETYSYDTASNRLLSMTDGTTTQTFSYGASGQITGDDRGAASDLGFVYDGSDRLVQLQSAGLPDTDYRHNAFGERVVKEDLGAAETTHFHYDQGGMLLAESDDLGGAIRSYIYLEGMPIAQIEPTGAGGAPEIAYLHSDHLGTPQAMTDAGVQLLWWRDQTPFGQTVASGGLGSSPLRFPGQFADAESGLHYNYFRDYDPALGRYIQSDPIGLAGGLNTYGYVKANPLRYADPLGLSPSFLDCLVDCIVDYYSIDDLRDALYDAFRAVNLVGWVPVSKRAIGLPVMRGASKWTNPVSLFGHYIPSINWKLGKQFLSTARFWGLLGRLNIFAGGVFLAWDAWHIGNCVHDCLTAPDSVACAPSPQNPGGE